MFQNGTVAPVASPTLISRRWAGAATGSPSTKPRTKYPHATRPKIAEDARARLIDSNRAAKKPPLGSRRTSGLEDGRSGAHSREMSEIPKFYSKMIKGGRWAVAITTGHGPVSFVGNFATEAEAQDWISTNAKDWPQPADKPMGPQSQPARQKP
jgi:hypothetical protein